MERRHLATIVSVLFAVFWAVPILRAEQPASSLPVPWLLCALFMIVAAGLAAQMRWARWLGLVAAAILAVLIPFVFLGAYFLSQFGDQAMGLDMAIWFIVGAGLAVTLLVLLATLTQPTPRLPT